MSTDLRKIDAIIAEKVMGWTELEENKVHHTGHMQLTGVKPGEIPSMYTGYVPKYEVPFFSIDINAAWNIIIKMNPAFWNCGSPEPKSKIIRVTFDIWNGDAYDRYLGEAETAPLAICLAAMKAVKVEVESA